MFPRFETVILYGLVQKSLFSPLPLYPYHENWNISLLSTSPAHQRGKFEGEGSEPCYKQVQPKQVLMWRTGGWQDHLLDVERHNSAGCFFKLLDKPSGNSYSFLKINMDHIPHQKAALGSPEVYSPGILRCFGFSGEDMVLWESSVYGKRMTFTWQGEEPAAKLFLHHLLCLSVPWLSNL